MQVPSDDPRRRGAVKATDYRLLLARATISCSLPAGVRRVSRRDGAAIELSRSRIEGRVRSLACIQGNALRLANRLHAVGPYDVIVAGGLLDYLPPRAARLLLRRMVGMLAPGGLLGVTNLARGNPWRILLELIAGWKLIERDEADMRGLLPTGDDFATEVVLDPTRLTWLMTLAKQPRSAPQRA